LDRKTPARLARALLTTLAACAALPSSLGVTSEILDRAEAALARGEAGETVELLRGRVSDSIRGSRLLGRAHAALGEHEAARKAFARAMRLDPGDLDSVVLFAEAAEKDRFFDRAIEAYRRALTMRPGNPDVLRRLAILLADLGRESEAVTALQAAAEALPEDLDLRFRLGVVELRRRRYEEAEAFFDRVLSRSGPTAAALMGRGIARARLAEARREAGSAFDAAERDLEEAARLAADDPAPSYDLGWVRELKRDRAGAESAYREALRRAADHERSLLRLARLLEERGEKAEALVLYRRAADRAGDPRIRRPLQDRIETLSRETSSRAPL
jgi:tetratricopeptide (TPR) repeat protein